MPVTTNLTERLVRVRGVNPDRKQMKVPLEVQNFFAELLNHVGKRSDWFATCITCEHWKEDQCAKFDCVPPPAVIADGCEYYEDEDTIPF